MKITMINVLVLFSFLSAALILPGAQSCFLKFLGVQVTIVNAIPNSRDPPVLVHCYSKDDDLGNQSLTRDQRWGFHFCSKPLSTKFTCDLNWGQSKLTFDAYDGKWLTAPCKGFGDCTYTVEVDGVHPIAGGQVYNWEI